MEGGSFFIGSTERMSGWGYKKVVTWEIMEFEALKPFSLLDDLILWSVFFPNRGTKKGKFFNNWGFVYFLTGKNWVIVLVCFVCSLLFWSCNDSGRERVKWEQRLYFFHAKKTVFSFNLEMMIRGMWAKIQSKGKAKWGWQQMATAKIAMIIVLCLTQDCR